MSSVQTLAGSSAMYPELSPSKSPGLGLGDVKVVSPLVEKQWDGRLKAHGDAGIFHSAGWARVLRDTYAFQPQYFIRSDAGAISDVFPVMEVRSRLTGARGVALPFTDYCEPLFTDLDAGKEMLRTVLDFGRAYKWKYFEMRGGSKLVDGVAPSLRFHGHSRELGGGEEGLFNDLKSECRTAVRRAEAAGVKVEISDQLRALRQFYNLHCDTRKRHGLPPQPFAFFENIHSNIIGKGNGFIVVGWFAKAPIAASVFFHFGDKGLYKFGASDADLQKLRATNLVMWEAMKYLANHNVKSLDLGRTSLSNEGLRRFKLSWGCSEKTLNYYRYSYQSNSFIADSDGTEGWHTRVFQMLPKFLSRLAGRLMYRHVA